MVLLKVWWNARCLWEVQEEGRRGGVTIHFCVLALHTSECVRVKMMMIILNVMMIMITMIMMLLKVTEMITIMTMKLMVLIMIIMIITISFRINVITTTNIQVNTCFAIP